MKVWDEASSTWVYTPTTVPLLTGALVPPAANTWADATDDSTVGFTPGTVHGDDMEWVANTDIGPDHYAQINTPGFYLVSWTPTFSVSPTVYIDIEFKPWNLTDSFLPVGWMGNLDNSNNAARVMGVTEVIRAETMFMEVVVSGAGGVTFNTPIPNLTIVRIG